MYNCKAPAGAYTWTNPDGSICCRTGLGAGDDITENLTRVAVDTVITRKEADVDKILAHADLTLYKADQGIDAVKWAAIFGLGLFGVLNLSRLMKRRK